MFRHSIKKLDLADVSISPNRETADKSATIHGELVGVIDVGYTEGEYTDEDISILNHTDYVALYGGDVSKRKTTTFMILTNILGNKDASSVNLYPMDKYHISCVHVSNDGESNMLFFKNFEADIALDIVRGIVEHAEREDIANFGIIDVRKYTKSIAEVYSVDGMRAVIGDALGVANNVEKPATTTYSHSRVPGYTSYYTSEKTPMFFSCAANDDRKTTIQSIKEKVKVVIADAANRVPTVTTKETTNTEKEDDDEWVHYYCC